MIALNFICNWLTLNFYYQCSTKPHQISCVQISIDVWKFMVHRNVFSSYFLFDHPCVYTSEEFMLTKSVFAKEKECFLLTFWMMRCIINIWTKNWVQAHSVNVKTKEFVITSSLWWYCKYSSWGILMKFPFKFSAIAQRYSLWITKWIAQFREKRSAR